MGTSRATLRRAIGRLCGDLIVSTATANGTTTTWIDTVNLVAADDSLIGRQMYFVSGTAGNVGLTRRITDSDEATGTVTFAAVTSTVAADVAELFSSRAVSPTPSEIHDKINDIIRSVAQQNLTTVDSTDATFDTDSPYIDVPSTWIGVCGAQWEDSNGIWHDVDRADWQLHKNLGTYGQVEIKNSPRWSADTLDIHLVGVTPAAELSTDAGTTIVHPEWLIKSAAGELLIQNARAYEDTAGAERRGNLWLQQANALRDYAQTRPPSNYVRVNRT
jgi:hypothetical protein